CSSLKTPERAGAPNLCRHTNDLADALGNYSILQRRGRPIRGTHPRLSALYGHQAKIDEMKRLASRLTWWHKAPQEHLAVNAAEGRGQPWTILASRSTRGKARSTSSSRTVRSSSAHPHRGRAVRRRARGRPRAPDSDRGLDRQRVGGART